MWYNVGIKYKIILTKNAKKDLKSLEKYQQEKLISDYNVVQNETIDAVNVKSLGNKLEIA